MHESFCVLSMKGSLLRICKNIFKKVSPKNRDFWLKIGYNSGYDIKYTWLLKVEYLLNRSTGLHDISNFSSWDNYWLSNNFFKDLCTHARAVHDPYFTNDPIFRSCALQRASTRILGFADILELVCSEMFPLDVGCE